mmetsp:Transcript_37380/g.42071  ORF Transcript_37380/g.42071 Transcript_37380/m.42071 type:complete len:100 (-) Transcript_37380:670-969(-)
MKEKAPPIMSKTIHRHQQPLPAADNESCSKLLYTGSNNPNRILTAAMKNKFVGNRSCSFVIDLLNDIPFKKEVIYTLHCMFHANGRYNMMTNRQRSHFH